MRIASLEAIPFALRFKEPFKTATGTHERREFALVKLTSRDGLVGIGECAPLMHMHGIDVAGAVRVIRRRCVPAFEFAGFTDMEMVHASIASDIPAPIRAALDIAAHDLLAQSKEVPLCQDLGASPRAAIKVNTVITAEEPSVVGDEGLAAASAGYEAIKLKLGFASDLQRVQALRQAVGNEVKIRVDPNGAWTTDQAKACIAAIAPFGVEYVEQPVGKKEIKGMREVRSGSPVPIFADESAATALDVDELNTAHACDGVVVKIASAGGLTQAAAIVEYANKAGLKTTLTSALDGPVGIAAGVHFAAARPELTGPSGLATLELFAETIADGPAAPLNGEIQVPTGSGLGIKIDEAAFAEVTFSVDE